MRRPRTRRAALAVAVTLLAGGCAQASDLHPSCRGEEALFILAAQAVPSATLLPCVAQLPVGWDLAGAHAEAGTFRFWLSSDRAGHQAVEVTLTATCDVGDAIEVPPAPDEAGTRRYEDPLALEPRLVADRYYTFPGGCARYAFRFASSEASPTLVIEAEQALSFRPRQALVDLLADLDFTLCGAGAPECP
jgi:hypothetical protein